MYKVHCMNNIATAGTDRLGANYQLTNVLEDADAIMVRSASLHGAQFPKGLLAIARAGAGVNNIPLERCADEGIVVFNTPGANANAVKELVFATLILASRDIVGGIEWVRAHAGDAGLTKQAEKAKKQFAGHELAGKRLGVIGLGAIGAAVANTATRFGMQAIGYDPYLSVSAAWNLDRRIEHADDLSRLVAACDYITIHVPAMDSTRHMVSAELIAQMKPGAVVLNFARDTIVDEQAMAAALAEGRVAHYVTDFPNPTSAAMDNAIVLPHLGASTTEAEENCAVMAAEELRDFIENGNVTHSVNFGAVDLGPIASGERLAVIHQNVQGMIGKFSQYLADSGINIENMANKSHGAMAYTLIDIAGEVPAGVIDHLAQAEGVRRTRVIRAS
ncbi:MAG: phosphoglycerate dehydrogenase [Coriobacteriaceae bacterium]|uniref:phosphoglycerate dehydrogenase n=1 Tax=Tractidigestivibacter sp. TaxID=2847320 RepID=UPI002A822A43|nr:phosphoglycerate dehydrogenase [Tractidigestivibacter sp.]MCI6547030.1 phosphoglycerate dehydrogenase [Coriobacteriaceae bacterium]MCI7437844.1 phosphoglycerate dehydrogenase [Coriobacteriaceae bacterium]MDD7583391.1 phosphoglycerate dehydrogenase [Coriobacteriaceae bacterium]MDY4535331.1 phosphoglycerate dehydrogenase [Tractidigestivibacter sp.]